MGTIVHGRQTSNPGSFDPYLFVHFRHGRFDPRAPAILVLELGVCSLARRPAIRALFPWAEFRKHKSAVKLHTLLDLRGNIPTIAIITMGVVHDVNILDDLIVEAGSIYILDRGYLDYGCLFKIHQNLGFFVTQAKINFSGKRLYSRTVDKSTGVQCDQIVTLRGYYAKQNYPEKLRCIRYFDSKSNKRLVFLTNNFSLPVETIAELYRNRWQVELLFKWIKQHLRVKAFYGTTENAVKTQIWIAISVYVFVAIVKKTLNLDHSLYTKTPILQALSGASYTNQEKPFSNQLNLFD